MNTVAVDVYWRRTGRLYLIGPRPRVLGRRYRVSLDDMVGVGIELVIMGKSSRHIVLLERD